MHYYQFNIGDYAKRTRHLSNTEDLAYRRLIDLYYTNESPMPDDIKQIARLITMRENLEEIGNVLSDFFVLDSGFWHNKRADEEIINYHAKAEVARANGRKGGRPPKPNPNPEETQRVNLANPEETGWQANQEPVTSNHETLNNLKEVSPSGSGNDVPNCPHQEIADLYMEILPELPRVKVINEERKRILRSTWKAHKHFQSLEFWKAYFEKIKTIDWIMGRTGTTYAIDFTYLIKQKNVIGVVEGKNE